MNGVFAVLLLISLIGLIWGLISPSHLVRSTKVHKNPSRKDIVIIFGLLFFASLIAAGYSAPKTVNLKDADNSNNQSTTKITPPPAPATPKPIVITKSVSETQPISYVTTDENDSSLAKGQTQVQQAGQNGTQTLIYNVTYTNGTQTNKVLSSSSVTTPAVNQIDDIGTYVAPTAPSPTSCTPISDEGTCYEPGEYCRDSDHGDSGIAGDGNSITCEDNDGWRWEDS